MDDTAGTPLIFLTQVLRNLVGNAIKFTDTGEVHITAKAVNGHFNSVTDTGPGIPEEHQARIFEQFHQVDSSNTKAKGGTGLGLAIAKQIVEMHGGRIWVESTAGKGSTFQMEIPVFTHPGSTSDENSIRRRPPEPLPGYPQMQTNTVGLLAPPYVPNLGPCSAARNRGSPIAIELQTVRSNDYLRSRRS